MKLTTMFTTMFTTVFTTVFATSDDDGSGEGASATVELAILLPVYLCLVVSLLTVGQLVLVRQGVILGTRNVAWRPTGGIVPVSEGDAPITNSFTPLANPTGYGKFSGSASVSTKDVKFVASGGAPELSLVTEDDRVTDGSPGGSGLSGKDAMTLALSVMNDEGHAPHLGRSTATGQFAYSAGWLPKYFASGTYTPSATCVVYYRKDPTQANGERPVYPSADGKLDHHPIEDLIGSKGSSNGFSITDIATGANRFFPPLVTDPDNKKENFHLQQDITKDVAGSDPGIWDSSASGPGFRIGGDVQSERNLFLGWESGH